MTDNYSRKEHRMQESRSNIVSDAKIDIDSHQTSHQMVKDVQQGTGMHPFVHSTAYYSHRYNPVENKLDQDKIILQSREILNKKTI
jgi:hypothetical protein